MRTMRLYKIIALLFCFATSYTLHAQEKNKSLNLEPLRLPTAPAATIISIQPNEVVKPKSAKELEAALLTNYLGDNNALSIPNNFMLEAMPYWMGDRKNIDIVKEYLNESIDNLAWKNLAISVASTQQFKISDSLNTNAIGFGFRTLLKRGSLFKDGKELIEGIKQRELLANLEGALGALSATVDTAGITTEGEFFTKLEGKYFNDPVYQNLTAEDKIAVQNILGELKKLKTAFFDVDTTEDNLHDFFKEELDEKTKRIKVLYNSFKNERTGLQVEVAGALALNFPTNETNFSTVPKMGLWLTATINPAKDKDGQVKSNFRKHTSLVFMARYIRNQVDYYQRYFPDSTGYYQNNFDVGVRFMYEKNRFSIGGEFLGRLSNSLLDVIRNPDGSITTTEKSNTDYKYVFNFSYMLSDNLVLSYSFGKQLDPALTVNGTLISQLGINLGFGGPQKKE